mgnify:CR=1 FL=1
MLTVCAQRYALRSAPPIASGLQLDQLACILAAWPLMEDTAAGSCSWSASLGVKVSTALGTDWGRACSGTYGLRNQQGHGEMHMMCR